MDGTIIQQGSFISDGTNITVFLRSGVDWMNVYNYSNIGGNTAGDGTEFYWQRGFAANDGLVKFHAAGTQVLSQSTAAVGVGAGAIGGFTLVDSSLQTVGPAVALTAGPAAISTAAPAVVTVGSTALLKTGDVVRFSNLVGAPQIAGIDWEITVTGPTTFTIPIQIAVAATAGFYRKISFPALFYPRRRFITTIIPVGAEAQVSTSVDDEYTVGQEVRFNVSAAFGMTEIDGLSGTITTIVAPNLFRVNIDVSTFTAFAFPTAAAVPFTPAEVIPLGEDTAIALNNGQDILADATINTGYIGIILAGGAASPAGSNGDLIYWVAGKSFNV